MPNGAPVPDDKFSELDKAAIRSYLVKLFAFPGIVVSVLIFFLGFFINDLAKGKAEVELLKSIQPVISTAFESKAVAETAKNSAVNLESELRTALKEARNFRDTLKLEQRQAETDPEKLSSAVASSLLSNQAFRDELVKAANSSSKPGMLRVADLQFCWGQQLITPRGDSAYPLLDFKFIFAEAFREKPIVVTGFNGQTSGYAYAVYSSSVTERDFSGAALEVLRRASS